jgi:hypothetical protein
MENLIGDQQQRRQFVPFHDGAKILMRLGSPCFLFARANCGIHHWLSILFK